VVVIFSETKEIGFVPIVKTKVKIAQAATKFAATPQIRIRNFLHIRALIKLSFA